MKIIKMLQLFLVAILIIGLATPNLTEATTSTSGNLMQIDKTVSTNSLLKGETTDVTLTVQGTPEDSTFIKPNDVVLIVDKSGSMRADNRLNAAKVAAKEFIDLMDLTKHKVGIVDYSTDVSSFPLTTDKDAAKAYVDTIQLAGGTNTSAAIKEATATLANHRPNAQPTIIIMTDGAADSHPAALAAAKEAKEAGITFYSIALLGPNEDPTTSAPNLLLMEMASSAKHHHFVLGSVGLADVYRKIVEEIGLASAYNVTITDTISPEFELVPGSYDNHIPRPTVTGNTLEWFISELKADQLSFTYQIRAKDDAVAGNYPAGQTSTTFEMGDGSTYSLDSTNPIIEIKNLAPIITSITEDKGLTAGGETVTITGQNFLPGAKVTFGANVATVISATETEIVVTAPTGSQGTVEVKVTNPDRQFAIGDYSYYALPTITSVSPSEGPLEGGNLVTVSGSSFMDGAIVYIDGVEAATRFATTSRLSVTIPAGTQIGTVNVKVVNPDQTNAELVDAYTYLAPPPPPELELHNLSMTSGQLEGGVSISLFGKNFDRAMKVYFGDIEVVTSFVTSSRVQVTVPAATSPGFVSVKAENPDGATAVLIDEYEYLAPPPPPELELTRLSVTTGFVEGGELVTIYGKNFDRNMKLYFGDQEVPFTFISSSRVQVTTPAATPGFVTVKAENSNGSTAELVDGFEFIVSPPLAAPIIVSLSANTILVEKSENIYVYGENFNKSSKVFIGNQEAKVTYLNPKSLRVTVPASNVAETVDVTVLNEDGQSALLEKSFTYFEPTPELPPVITSLDITSGSNLGGETIIITGENFKRSARVYFGDVQATTVISVTDTEITFKTPVYPTTETGLVDVTVVNTDGQATTLVDGFEYTGKKVILTRLSQDSGSSNGGYNIVVYGSNFDKTMEVYVGGTKTTFVTLAATRIRVAIPAGSPGDVDITFTIGNQSTSIPYTYN